MTNENKDYSGEELIKQWPGFANQYVTVYDFKKSRIVTGLLQVR